MRVGSYSPLFCMGFASDSFGRVPCILQYLVNEIRHVIINTGKRKKEQVYYEGIKPSGTDNKNVFDRNLS